MQTIYPSIHLSFQLSTSHHPLIIRTITIKKPNVNHLSTHPTIHKTTRLPSPPSGRPKHRPEWGSCWESVQCIVPRRLGKGARVFQHFDSGKTCWFGSCCVFSFVRAGPPKQTRAHRGSFNGIVVWRPCVGMFLLMQHAVMRVVSTLPMFFS